MISRIVMSGVLRVYYPALVGLKPGVRVLVAGGTGTVGSGTVLSLLKQGVHVVVATRSQEKFEELRDITPDDVSKNLWMVKGDVSSRDGVMCVLEKATAGDKEIHHVVSSLGGWWQKGPMTDQSLQEFDRTIRDHVAGHFLLMRTFLPYLNTREGSTYTIVTNDAANQCPAPETSLLCVGSGAAASLAMAACAEYSDMRVALSQFHIRCNVLPKADCCLTPENPFSVGHDLIGAAIASTIAAKVRGKLVINNRYDARTMLHATSR